MEEISKIEFLPRHESFKEKHPNRYETLKSLCDNFNHSYVNYVNEEESDFRDRHHQLLSQSNKDIVVNHNDTSVLLENNVDEKNKKEYEHLENLFESSIVDYFEYVANHPETVRKDLINSTAKEIKEIHGDSNKIHDIVREKENEAKLKKDKRDQIATLIISVVLIAILGFVLF